MRDLPSFFPIEAPEDMDWKLESRLRPMALAVLRIGKLSWEGMYRRDIKTALKASRVRRAEMEAKMKSWSERTGRPIRPQSTLRFMEIWEAGPSTFLNLLIFRDASHAIRSIRDARIQDVMDS